MTLRMLCTLLLIHNEFTPVDTLHIQKSNHTACFTFDHVGIRPVVFNLILQQLDMPTVSCCGCVVTQRMYMCSLCGKICRLLMLFNMRLVTVLFLNSFVLEVTLNKISSNLMFCYKSNFLRVFEILHSSCQC